MPEKPKCPSCEIELVDVDGEAPKTCAACQFPVSSYPGFKAMFKKFMTDWAEENKAKSKGKKEKSFFDVLGGL